MSLLDNIANSLKKGVNNVISNKVDDAKDSLGDTVSNLAQKAKDGIRHAVENKTKTIRFKELPTTLEEFKALEEAKLTDYFASAALAVLALNVCATDMDEGARILEFLNGPNDFSGQDRQFIENQFMDGRSYVTRSYFKGATPENNYTPDKPYAIEVTENPHSRDAFEQGYITLYLESGGADSLRPIVLRTKKSTGEWFVNDFRALLAGIRKTIETDEWA